MNLNEFINQKVEKIKPIEKISRLAWWDLAVTGEERFSEELQKSITDLRKIFSSKTDYDQLKAFPSEINPKIHRQHSLLLQSYIENQIPSEMLEYIVKLETEIESIYTNFRPIIEGKELSNNDLKEILVHSTDSKKRQQAWEASKEIGLQVERRVLDLIKKRNENAKQVGFSNYYSMRLHLQEIDEKELFHTLEKLDQSLMPVWDKYKSELDQKICEKMSIRMDEIMPWHYQDPFFQEAPSHDIHLDYFYNNKNIVEISERFFESLDLDVKDILGRSDLFEREKKNQHAFCTCIDHEQDIRVLCNLKDNEWWMGTQLHELGHAVYDKYIDPNLPYLLREPAHICMTEAIAMLFGRLSKNTDFIQTYCDIPEKIDASVRKQTEQQLRDNLLVFSRWCLVMIYFEREMYQNQEADLNCLWWDLVEKFQKVKRPAQRFVPDWAAKLHLACAPVYYQNYILGEMIASQLKHVAKGFSGEKAFFESIEVGHWLKESLFKLGRQFLWQETLQKATGEKLNSKYFVEDLKN